MTKRTLIPLILAGLIAAMLGGGYAIVANTTGGAESAPTAPSGFFH
jgi:hypothetical protein